MPDQKTRATEVYVDYAASTPPFPEALVAQSEAAQRWFGNPSAAHRPGRGAHGELERLRQEFEALCGFHGGRLLLMASATEANNWIVHGMLATAPAARVLVAEDVHASVWNPCRRYAERMDVLPLDPQGRIPLASLTTKLRADTRLVCCSHVANETGVIHEVAALAAACERRGILCHVDGAQALGHIPLNLNEIACDFYVFGAHKFGGPRGCGGVFARSTRVDPWMQGGTQEWGLRPGTENLPAFAGTVAALRLATATIESETPRLRGLAQVVLEWLRTAGFACEVNGNPDAGRPGLLSLSFPGYSGHALAADLALQGIAVAVGSACSEDRPEPSRTILALGRPPAVALGTLRISFGRLSRLEDAEAVAEGLTAALHRQAGGT